MFNSSKMLSTDESIKVSEAQKMPLLIETTKVLTT